MTKDNILRILVCWQWLCDNLAPTVEASIGPADSRYLPCSHLPWPMSLPSVVSCYSCAYSRGFEPYTEWSITGQHLCRHRGVVGQCTWGVSRQLQPRCPLTATAADRGWRRLSGAPSSPSTPSSCSRPCSGSGTTAPVPCA